MGMLVKQLPERAVLQYAAIFHINKIGGGMLKPSTGVVDMAFAETPVAGAVKVP